MHDSIFRILTLNVHKGYSLLNSRFVLHEIREAIREDAPDIVFLQEVVGSRLRRPSRRDGKGAGKGTGEGAPPEESQHGFLADRVWEHVVYSRNNAKENSHHGNAVLSVFPILSSHHTNLSTNRVERRGMVHCRIGLPDGATVHAICLHLGLSNASRMKQVDLVSAYHAEHIPPGEPVILAGDFNDWTIKITKQLARDAGLYEAFESVLGKPALTFPSLRPMLRLDRVYLRGLEVVSATVHKKGVWGKLSDHLPLSVDVRVPGA